MQLFALLSNQPDHVEALSSSTRLARALLSQTLIAGNQNFLRLNEKRASTKDAEVKNHWVGDVCLASL